MKKDDKSRLYKEIRIRRDQLIRELRREGYYSTHLADLFGMNHSTVLRITSKGK